MKKKDKGRLWLWISMVLIAILAVLTGYFWGLEKSREESKRTAIEKTKKEGPPPQPQQETQESKAGPVFSGEITQAKPFNSKEYCLRTEADVQDFFKYLNKQSYVQHLEEGSDTYGEFKRLLKKLSSNLPIPGGEGVDPTVMEKNIYHLFRVLSRSDIRLIKEVISNEADTLELNLEMFYRYLTLENQCPDPEGIRPSFDALYHYAGFFLDTIGGRAYLSRRPMALRMLLSYYSLLIIHEADNRGKNTYGIDIFPLVGPLMTEINLYPDFKQKKEYLQKLNQIESYYLKKR
jgi:hypothetical protein